MAVQTSEIKFYKSVYVNDGATNGGRLSTNEVLDNIKNNLWPDVPQAERTTGSTKYRKCFIKVANDADLALISPRVFVENPTSGDDRILIFPATQTDTQDDLSGSERLYGCGQLNQNIAVGATTLGVVVEEGTDEIFQNGDLIRISNKVDVNDENGTEEFLQLAASNAVSWNGDLATLTLASGQTPQNAYQASNTRVASVIEGSDIEATFDTWSESSAAGTYNETTDPPLLDHIGSMEETWTLTFTSATAFGCVGDSVGAVTGGTVGSNFAPTNSAFGKPWFTLRATGWGGTWSAGDTVTFRTHPAALPIWEKRVVPANANSISGNRVIVAVVGESE